MAGWNGAGTFSKNFVFANDAAAGIKILASRQDQQWDTVVAGINNCLAKDGQNFMTGTLNAGGQAITNVASGLATGNAVNWSDLINYVKEFFTIEGAINSIPVTFVSATQFKATGSDYTTSFVPGRRVKFTVTAGTAIGVVKSSSYGAPDTTVNMSFLFGGNQLDAGVIAPKLGIIQSPQGGDAMGSCFLANLSGTQAPLANTDTQMNFDTLFQDQIAETSLPQFIPRYGGRYLITVTWNPSVTQQYTIGPRVNNVGSTAYQELRTVTAGDVVTSTFQVSAPPTGPIDVWIKGLAGFTLGTQVKNAINISQIM